MHFNAAVLYISIFSEGAECQLLCISVFISHTSTCTKLPLAVNQREGGAYLLNAVHLKDDWRSETERESERLHQRRASLQFAISFCFHRLSHDCEEFQTGITPRRSPGQVLYRDSDTHTYHLS